MKNRFIIMLLHLKTIFYIIYIFMKRKFKEWWSSISPISTSQTTTSHFLSLNIKKTMTYIDLQVCILSFAPLYSYTQEGKYIFHLKKQP